MDPGGSLCDPSVRPREERPSPIHEGSTVENGNAKGRSLASPPLESVQRVSSASQPIAYAEEAHKNARPSALNALQATGENSEKDTGDVFVETDETEPYDENEDAEGDDDLDVDAEAEALARSVGNQILAQIGVEFGGQPQPVPPITPGPAATSPDEDPIIATIRYILEQAHSNGELLTTLQETTVPRIEREDESLFAVLSHIATSGEVEPGQAESLSSILLTIASSLSEGDDEDDEEEEAEAGPSIPVEDRLGKRKRENEEDSRAEPRPPPRVFIHTQGLFPQIANAVTIISDALRPDHSFGPIDPGLVASIQVPLYQVFLFAATAGSTSGPRMGILHEICGLIQVIGVLSGIPIGPAPAITHPMYNSSFQPGLVDIGTAVYPCQHSECGKIFSRLYSLRSHARLHMTGRPFRCDVCTAAFARNHDLRRHARSHGSKAFRCVGCKKTFSRRDALKRHKSNAKDIPACSETPMEVVETIQGGKHHRTRPLQQTEGQSAPTREEGEMDPAMIEHACDVTAQVHPILHNRIAQAVGVERDASGRGTWPSAFTAFVNGAHLPASHTDAQPPPVQPSLAPLTEFGLNEEQTRLLENAIASAAQAAQAQAEVEARIEEEEEEDGMGTDEEGYEEEGLDDGEGS